MHARDRRQRRRLNSYVKICERTSVTHHFSAVAHYFSDLLLQLQLYYTLHWCCGSTWLVPVNPVQLFYERLRAREDLKLKIKRGKKRRSKRGREGERVGKKTWGKRKKSYVLYYINTACLVYTVNKKRWEKILKITGPAIGRIPICWYLVLPSQSGIGT